MLTRTARIVLLCVLLIGWPGHGAVGQETGEPLSTQPAVSQPASAAATQPVNRLRSPYDAVHFFLETVRDVDRGEERYADAMVCLDFGDMDPEVLQDAGPRTVRQLAEILGRLVAEGHFDPENKELLPDTPTLESGKLLSLGRDPLVLVLERIPRREVDPATGAERTVQEWRFSNSTAGEVAKWYAELDTLIERMQAGSPAATVTEGPPTVEPDALGSPYQTVIFFLDAAHAAQEDGTYYTQAFACLDFSEAVAAALQDELQLEDPAEVARALKSRGAAYVEQFKEEQGIRYVDGLAAVIEALREAAVLKLEDLPRTLPPEHKGTWAIGGDPLEVLLVRQAAGVWRFNSTTVRNVPRMVVELKSRAEAARPSGGPMAAPASAAPEEAATAGAPVAAPARSASRAPKEFRSARATLYTFRKAMQTGDLKTAVNCLDLSELSVSEEALAPTLAGKLWLVMTRIERVPDATVSDDPDGGAYELLARMAGRIEIDRQWAAGREAEWLFTARTVRDIEDLYEAFEREPIHADWQDERLSFWTLPSLYVRENLVPTVAKRPLLGLRVWQWVGLLVLLLAGVLVRSLSQVVLPRISRRLLRTEGSEPLLASLRNDLRPTSTLVMVAAWWGGLQFLDLGFTAMHWTWLVLKIVMAVVGVYASYRLIDIVMNFFLARAVRTASRLDDVLVPLLRKTLKVIVVVVGAVFVANVFGLAISPLLAGLGVGGLAFGLAAQDTLKNFFGSVNVVLDQPFQVGDWVKIGDAEGTVESVGLRSSRIRTFYNSQLTVPNSEIMNSFVDNMGRRRYRRTSAMLSVTYATKPEALEAFCEGIREIIRRHPFTRKDYFHVYVNKFAASSIDIILYCFHECPDWSVELQERHRLYLDIIRLANRLGVSFAFPTQTIHLHQEDAAGAAGDAAIPADPEQAVGFGRAQAEAIVAKSQGKGTGQQETGNR